MLYGAPLVLKLDNGSPFVAGVDAQPITGPVAGDSALFAARSSAVQCRRRLRRVSALPEGTHPLPGGASGGNRAWSGRWRMPRRPGQQANTLGRPWGAHGHRHRPSRFQASRHIVTNQERQAFAASVASRQEEAAASLPVPASVEPAAASGVASEPVPPTAVAAASVVDHPTAGGVAASSEASETAALGPHPAVPSGTDRDIGASKRAAQDGAARQRQAISHALVAHGYLLLTRRRIPLPIKREKVT